MGGQAAAGVPDRELRAPATNRPSPPRSHSPLPALRRELEEEEKERRPGRLWAGSREGGQSERTHMEQADAQLLSDRDINKKGQKAASHGRSWHCSGRAAASSDS